MNPGVVTAIVLVLLAGVNTLAYTSSINKQAALVKSLETLSSISNSLKDREFWTQLMDITQQHGVCIGISYMLKINMGVISALLLAQMIQLLFSAM